jgi:hypothetical protein
VARSAAREKAIDHKAAWCWAASLASTSIASGSSSASRIWRSRSARRLASAISARRVLEQDLPGRIEPMPGKRINDVVPGAGLGRIEPLRRLRPALAEHERYDRNIRLRTSGHRPLTSPQPLPSSGQPRQFAPNFAARENLPRAGGIKGQLFQGPTWRGRTAWRGCCPWRRCSRACALAVWWADHSPRLADLPQTRALNAARAELLKTLLGKDAPNLSAAVIGRLKSECADGVYLQARMEPQAECLLVLMGATPEGRKELIGFQTGMRESGQSWKELLVDLKARGLSIAPEVAIGDGALGFWKALDEAFPTTRHQRCWLHKTLNILDKFPKLLQPNAHKDLREIWLSPDRASAEAAMATFAEKYTPKYDKAVECLIKDRQTLLTFFDLPADHWDHLRTSNPIESVFATVRHRTVRMKGALSQDTARLMVFKLVMAASRTWRRLKGQNQLPKVVNGIKFKDGIEPVAEIKPAA